MSRLPGGDVRVDTLADGTRAFRLRFRAGGRREPLTLHERRECACGCGGGWSEQTARIELDNVLARVRAGVWEKRAADRDEPGPAPMPTFHEYASWWLQAKTDVIPAWMSSHPASAERIASIRHSGASKAATRPALSPAEWNALKDGCHKK